MGLLLIFFFFLPPLFVLSQKWVRSRGGDFLRYGDVFGAGGRASKRDGGGNALFLNETSKRHYRVHS